MYGYISEWINIFRSAFFIKKNVFLAQFSPKQRSCQHELHKIQLKFWKDMLDKKHYKVNPSFGINNQILWSLDLK